MSSQADEIDNCWFSVEVITTAFVEHDVAHDVEHDGCHDEDSRCRARDEHGECHDEESQVC